MSIHCPHTLYFIRASKNEKCANVLAASSSCSCCCTTADIRRLIVGSVISDIRNYYTGAIIPDIARFRSLIIVLSTDSELYYRVVCKNALLWKLLRTLEHSLQFTVHSYFFNSTHIDDNLQPI